MIILNCTICSFSSYAKSDMKNHVKLVHDKERPFKCSVCNATFQTKAKLNRHAPKESGCKVAADLALEIGLH